MHDLVVGLGYLGKGQRWVLRHGRWWGFGLLPGLVALVLYVGVLLALGFWVDDIAAWATPFADGWGSPWQGSLRWVFALSLYGLALVLAVVTFTAATLLIGEPFYESLSEQVEQSEGSCPQKPEIPLWREVLTSARDSIQVLLRVLCFVLPLFVLGFVPVIGQTVIPVLGVCVSGYFLTVELSAVAMQRRAIPLRERLRLLRGRRMLALGFGVPLALSFMVPLVAVFVMPGAVAGAALLVRDLVPDPGAEQAEPQLDAPSAAPAGARSAAQRAGSPADRDPYRKRA